MIPSQWSFRGGTRGNAVPIVKIPLERMGTAFPLLNYGQNAWERCCIVTKLHNTFHFSPITPINLNNLIFSRVFFSPTTIDGYSYVIDSPKYNYSGT